MAQANCLPSSDCVPIPAGTPERSTNPITTAYAGLLARLANRQPRRMLIAFGRALERAFSAYVGALLHDTNVPRVLDLREMEALIADLISEVTGTLRNAAEVAAEVGS